MEEQFLNLEFPFERYQISNMGRVISPRRKELTSYMKKDHGCTYRVIIINTAKKRKSFYIANEVYKAFGQGYKNGATVFYKDGDHSNCRIDNLFISKGYTTAPDEEQIAKYENEAKACILHFIGVKKYNEVIGLDVDNIIGNAYLLIWQHLSQYKIGTSFYSFCARYVKWAFLYEYKKYKNKVEHCLSYEQLQERNNA